MYPLTTTNHKNCIGLRKKYRTINAINVAKPGTSSIDFLEGLMKPNNNLSLIQP